MVLNYKKDIEKEKEDLTLKICKGETFLGKFQFTDPTFLSVDVLSFKKIYSNTYLLFINEISLMRIKNNLDVGALILLESESVSKGNFITLKIEEIDSQVNTLTVSIDPITFSIEENIKTFSSLDNVSFKGKLYIPWKVKQQIYGNLSAVSIESNHPAIKANILENTVLVPYQEAIIEEVGTKMMPATFMYHNYIQSFIFKVGMNVQFTDIPNQIYSVKKVEITNNKNSLKLYLDRSVATDENHKIHPSDVPNAVLNFNSSDEEKKAGIVNVGITNEESQELVPYSLGALYYWDVIHKNDCGQVMKLLNGKLVVENTTTNVVNAGF